MIIIAHSHHRAVGFQADGMLISCADGHNIRPVADIATADIIARNILSLTPLRMVRTETCTVRI